MLPLVIRSHCLRALHCCRCRRFLAISVRVLFDKAGVCPIQCDRKLSRYHAERDEKVDGCALTTGSGGASIVQAGISMDAPLDDKCSMWLVAHDGRVTAEEAGAEQQLTAESVICSPLCHVLMATCVSCLKYNAQV